MPTTFDTIVLKNSELLDSDGVGEHRPPFKSRGNFAAELHHFEALSPPIQRSLVINHGIFMHDEFVANAEICTSCTRRRDDCGDYRLTLVGFTLWGLRASVANIGAIRR